LFTGLIQDLGKVQRIERRERGLELTIATGLDLSGVRTGDSIAVDGACLTVIRRRSATFTAEVSKETLERTTLAKAKEGQVVNLEPALKMTDALGGHFVTGHVDGTGEIIGIVPEGNSFRYRFRGSPAVARFLVEKGSIAVDGISLTVADCEGQDFSTSVLPYTADQTTLGKKTVGDSVNLEGDLIAKYVEKFLRPGESSGAGNSRLSLSFLEEQGFIKKLG
jgi:riboflavin synthase